MNDPENAEKSILKRSVMQETASSLPKILRHEAFFGLHFDLHPRENDFSLGADCSEENIIELLERVQPDHVAYDCKGHEGFTGFPTSTGTPSPGIVKDALAVWRKITKKHGVLLGIHYSGLVDHHAVITHPEWAVHDKNGTPDKTTASTFGPYVDLLMIPQLVEAARLYELDSIWVDGECWAAKFDYSPAALAAWTQFSGGIEPPKDPDHSRWLEWKKFHRDRFEHYLAHWTSEVKLQIPGIEAASNWAFTTMMPKPVSAPIDYISGDFDPFLSVDRARTEVRYLANTGLPWELQSWTFDLVEGQDECSKLPCHLMQEAGVVMMYGGGYMLYNLPTRSGYIEKRIIDTAAEVAKFCRERQNICFRNTGIPQAAVFYSSADQLNKSNNVYTWWGDRLDAVEGVLHALLELHCSVDIITEYMLPDKLKNYPLLIVPDLTNMELETVSILRGYVEEGGNLLLIGSSCSLPFFPDLGLIPVGKPSPVHAVLKTARGKISASGKWQSAAIDNSLNSKATHLKLWYRYTGKGPHARSSYMDLREDGVSQVHAESIRKEIAAAAVTSGKGRLAAVLGQIDVLYFNTHHPFLRSFIGEVVSEVFPDSIFIMNSSLPSYVDIALRKTPDDILSVHLLNLANMPTAKNRAFLDGIPPLYNLEFSLRLDKQPEKAVFEPGGISIAYDWNDGIARFIVPVLEIHGVVIISGL